jgi:hypothetical protein
MKLFTFIILGMVLIQPLAVYAYRDIPLHEDPEAAGVEIDASLLFYYALLFKAILYPEDYNLTSLIELYRDMYIPPDLEYILTRMNELILSLDKDINETRFHIDHALDYINFKAFKEALEELYEARISLAHANITYQDLLEAIDELLRAFSKYRVADGRFTEGRDELRNLSREIEDLLMRLLMQIESMEEESEHGYKVYYEGKEETFLSIYVNSSEAWVGSYIDVYGRLYTRNSSLSNRVVRLYVAGVGYTTVTNANGDYSFSIRLPYVYRDSISITVYYIPIDVDKEFYAPAINKTVVQLLYVKTSVSIEVDEKAYPGLPLNVTISISPSPENVSRRVSIYIDDVFMGRFPVRDSFSTSFTLPSDMVIGRHIIGVDVEAYKEYAPAKAYMFFTVTYMDIDFEIDVSPKVVIYPIVKPTVHGRAVIPPDEPYADRLVQIYVDSTVYEAYTNGIGYFSISIDPPFTIVSFTVRATIHPGEPWYPKVTRVIQIYTVNLYLLLLIGLLLTASIYVLGRVLGGRPPEAVEEAPRRERRVRIVEDIVIPTLISRRPRPPVERDPVVDIYYSAVNIVSDKVGPPRYDETLREYFRRASSELGDAGDAFWRLTLLAERFLYSGYESTEEDVSLARSYYEELRRVLYEE